MLTLESFQNQYDIETSEITIKNKRFSFFRPRSIENFLEKIDFLKDFPMWSKVWEASLVLADHLAGIQPRKKIKYLEIGCGLGVVGIVASAFGHDVLLTEYDENALNFTRANAILNDISHVNIMQLDWNNPVLSGSFDYIIGSEIVYKETNFVPLGEIFKKYLRKTGAIILCEAIRETSMKFMKIMGGGYHITARKIKLQSTEQERYVMLCNLRRKYLAQPAETVP